MSRLIPDENEQVFHRWTALDGTRRSGAVDLAVIEQAREIARLVTNCWIGPPEDDLPAKKAAKPGVTAAQRSRAQIQERMQKIATAVLLKDQGAAPTPKEEEEEGGQP